MRRRIRFAGAFEADLRRHYEVLLALDIGVATRAYEAVERALDLLADFPFIGRSVTIEGEQIIARELLIPFGSAGYVILYEVEDNETVTVLAMRHQREDDYH